MNHDLQQMLAYFERQSRENTDPHWQRGVEMCRHWADIKKSPSQATIDQFLLDFSAESNPGTGWIDLGLRFRFWARSEGFEA